MQNLVCNVLVLGEFFLIEQLSVEIEHLVVQLDLAE